MISVMSLDLSDQAAWAAGLHEAEDVINSDCNSVEIYRVGINGAERRELYRERSGASSWLVCLGR
mgnify:CR=1 FL=1|jgi:hypothetical protein